MLTLLDRKLTRNCQGFSRREFLRIGALGLGGMTLPGLLASQAQSAELGKALTGKSVVLLFLQGGPAHIEFFDPKMTAPVEIRSITGEVKTKTPGITFGGTFPKLAAMTDKFSIVRSYASRNSGHTYLSVTSAGNPLKASMSSLYSRIVGTNNPNTGLPTNTLIKPEAIQGDLKLRSNFETGALPTLTDPGSLGKSFRAFDPSGGGQLKANMEMKIAPERLADRRSLLSGLDRIRRSVDATGDMEGADKFQQQAFEVITRGAADAFDLSKEDPKTVAKYDTTGVFKSKDINRWYDMSRSTNLLGHQMLLARRLCERGCGFVTVSDCGWDMHANNNSPKGMTGIYPMGHQVDHAVSAFIQDIHARGLEDKIMLVVTGEMGRTPRINKNGGRDHYGNLTSLLVSGGGLKMGRVIGQSDRTASQPSTEPYTPKELMATINHTLFDIGKLRLVQGIPGDVARVVTGGDPIGPLHS
jgi:hypothetical protein